MTKSAGHKPDPDRILWTRAKQICKQVGNFRPSPEELAQFLDHTADENVWEKIFTWLANEEGAVAELLVLRQPLRAETLVDQSRLDVAESRARSLVAASLKKHEATFLQSLRNMILDFIYFRNWAATAFAACFLIVSSAFAFHLGISTFQNRQQAETILMNELTFGLTESLTPQKIPCKTQSGTEDRKP